ncbi:transposase [Nonomuraea sp. NPDC049637]|uniref:transposase n=1 Tax=Nonomuraea sp. NPDC049637 TaxID=3154356 RepID=UPI0034271BBB
MFYQAQTGCIWRDLPATFGDNPRAIYQRHRHWSIDGTWEKVMSALESCGAEDAQ